MKMQTKVNRNGPRLRVALVEADGAWQDRLTSFFTARPDCVWLGAGATPMQYAKRLDCWCPEWLPLGTFRKLYEAYEKIA